jgi:hypothetical protein
LRWDSHSIKLIILLLVLLLRQGLVI